MGKNDQPALIPGDIFEAIALLTRLPVTSRDTRGARAAWAWPIAGATVGLFAAIVASLALWLGLSSWIAAGIALTTQILLTGALHEDGLADCADGFWGGFEPARRLEIMRDSHIGVYGTIAIVLSLLFRWSLIFALCQAGTVFAPLIAIGAISRVPMVALMHGLPAARADGLSATTGKPGRDTVILAAVTALLIALPTAGFTTIAAAIAAILLSFGIAKLALAKINGQTGDVLGASQQVSEIGMLLVFTALLT